MSKTTPRRYARALVVANPWAGRGKGTARAEALAAGLERLADRVDLHLTTARRCGHDRVAASPPETDLVVSVGGDGTLSEVLEGLGQRDVVVAQAPMGTANVLAKELRLPTKPEPILDMLGRGRTTWLDTARVADRLCFLCTGVGFDGMAVAEVEARRNGPIAKLNYVTAGLRVLGRYRAPQLSIDVDGESIDGTFGWVLVSNLREYGAVFQLSPESRRDDGKLEVYAVRTAGRLGLAGLGLAGLLRRLPGRRAEFWQAERVRVRSAEPVAYQVDGDLGGRSLDLEIAISPNRFRIAIP